MIIIIIICRCLITNAYPSTAHHVNKVCWYLFYMHMYTQTCTLYTHVQNICIWPHMYTIIVCAQMCSSCVLCAYTVTIRGVLKNTKHKNLQEREKYQRNTFWDNLQTISLYLSQQFQSFFGKCHEKIKK